MKIAILTLATASTFVLLTIAGFQLLRLLVLKLTEIVAEGWEGSTLH